MLLGFPYHYGEIYKKYTLTTEFVGRFCSKALEMLESAQD